MIFLDKVGQIPKINPSDKISYATIYIGEGEVAYNTVDQIFYVHKGTTLLSFSYATILAIPTTYLMLDCSNDPLTGNLLSNANITATNFISSVAIGTQPYACTSTTLNTNLNADLLDGLHASAFAPANHSILSATHGDSTAAVVVRGDIITGQGVAPTWSRLAISIPAVNIRNVFGIDNGELEPSWKATLDATLPTTITVGSAGTAGTSLIYSHRDHEHPTPATWTPSSHTHNSHTSLDVAGNHAKLIPSADAVTAIQLTKADGVTSILNVDSTNNRIGINESAPTDALHIVGRINMTPAAIAVEAFNILGRTGTGLGFPVSVFTPTTNNTPMVWDISPKGTAADIGTIGNVYLDMCSTDYADANYEALRFAKKLNGNATIGTVQGGTGTVRDLDIQYNGGLSTFGGNIMMGTSTGVSTATPMTLNMGGTYSSTPGIGTKFWLIGSNAANVIGLGASVGGVVAAQTQMDFMVHNNANYGWYHNGNLQMSLVGSTAAFDVNGVVSSSPGTFAVPTNAGLTRSTGDRFMLYEAANYRIVIGSASTGMYIQNTGGGSSTAGVRFYTGASTATERLYIARDGQIAIGAGITPTAMLHLPAGTATASTAPLKFTSGTNLTIAEAGAIEFTTDDYYATITTGAARKNITLWNTLGTIGQIPYCGTNGRLLGQTPVTNGTYVMGLKLTGGGTDGTLTITNGVITAITQAT